MVYKLQESDNITTLAYGKGVYSTWLEKSSVPYYSTDLLNWSLGLIKSKVSGNPLIVDSTLVSSSDGYFIGVVRFDTVTPSKYDYYITRSTDGREYTISPDDKLGSGDNFFISKVKCIDDRIFIVDSSGNIYSTDKFENSLGDWTTYVTGLTDIYDLAWDGKSQVLFKLEDEGEFASYNIKTQAKPVKLSSGIEVQSIVAYGAGVFVYYSINQHVMYYASDITEDWTEVELQPEIDKPTPLSYPKLIYEGGYFILSGSSTIDPENGYYYNTFYSKDGKKWNKTPTKDNAFNPRGILYDGNNYIIYGSNGQDKPDTGFYPIQYNNPFVKYSGYTFDQVYQNPPLPVSEGGHQYIFLLIIVIIILSA